MHDFLVIVSCFCLAFFVSFLFLVVSLDVSSKQKHKLETQSENVFEAKDEKKGKEDEEESRKVKGLERVTASLSLIACADRFLWVKNLPEVSLGLLHALT